MREKRIEDKARARLFCARLMAVILAAGIAAYDDLPAIRFCQSDRGRHRGRKCQDAPFPRRGGALLRTDASGYQGDTEL